MTYSLSRSMWMLMLLVVLHKIPAKKSRRLKSQCPGMPASRQKSFDDVLHYAAEISSAHRSLEAHECFSLAVSLATNEKERNIALYNLAVVQKDLNRSLLLVSHCTNAAMYPPKSISIHCSQFATRLSQHPHESAFAPASHCSPPAIAACLEAGTTTPSPPCSACPRRHCGAGPPRRTSAPSSSSAPAAPPPPSRPLPTPSPSRRRTSLS